MTDSVYSPDEADATTDTRPYGRPWTGAMTSSPPMAQNH